MSEHLSETLLNSFADDELDELSPAQTAELEAHLAQCPACATKALSQMRLKRATAQAGQRYELPPQMLKRLREQHAEPPARSQPMSAGWTIAIAAILIVVAGIGVMQLRSNERAEAAIITEMTDQHVSGMILNQTPEILSSDRHTVKPWFQGKIPFSFNLPDGLPGDTTLDGANLVYQGHRPVAQLLYSIGKHRISVFVRERDSEGRDDREFAAERSGFHIAALRAGELYIVAVSDVEQARLDALASAIRNAQAPDRTK